MAKEAGSVVFVGTVDTPAIKVSMWPPRSWRATVVASNVGVTEPVIAPLEFTWIDLARSKSRRKPTGWLPCAITSGLANVTLTDDDVSVAGLMVAMVGAAGVQGVGEHVGTFR